MSSHRFRWSLFAIIVLHWLIMGLFAFEVIPQTTKAGGDTILYFHHGGDNYDYFSQAQALSRGEVEESRVPIGYAFLLLPAVLFGNPTHDMLVQPISFLWSIILLPVSVLLLAWISNKIMKNHALTLITCLIYVLLPILYFVVFNLIWNPYMAEIIAIHSTWAQMLTDGPTGFISLLIVALFIIARERDYPYGLLIGVGLLIGFLGTIRLTGILVGSGLFLVLLLERKWLGTIIMGISMIIGNLPQLLYNATFFGNPFTTGYNELAGSPENGLFHPIYLWDALNLIWADFGIALIIVLVIGAVGISISLYALAQKHWAYALIIGGWLLSYLALYSIYSHSWRGAMMRFMIPVEAPASLFLAIMIFQLKSWITPNTSDNTQEGRQA